MQKPPKALYLLRLISLFNFRTPDLPLNNHLANVKSQGFSLCSVLSALLLCRLGGLSVYAMQCVNLHGDKNEKDRTLLLTTDLTLSFTKAMELYQIRRSIEVMFYETLGELFRQTQSEMPEQTLCERILHVFLTILGQLLEILSIDVNETIRQIMADDRSSKGVLLLLNAVNQENMTQFTTENVA
jgi:hypothetical protein